MSAADPLTRAQVWRRFLLWMLGVPTAIVAAPGIIAGSLWLSGGDLAWQAVSDPGTTVFWIGAIVLMYPVLIWVWIGALRQGLHAAAAWDAPSFETPDRVRAARPAAATKSRRGRAKAGTS